MILDNTGIDYARMLLFVFDFFLYWKIATSATPGLLRDYKAVKSMLSKKL